MARSSANTARIFGIILIVLISAWDMDAMRPHIVAHSWGTLGLVALFLVVHLSDYLTVGRLVNHLDPLVFAMADATPTAFSPTAFSSMTQPTAKLYTFTAVTTIAKQVSGSPYPVTQQHFIVTPE
jgi:hypothetical protein